MTIAAKDLVPDSHFAGGANIGDGKDKLAAILNAVKAALPPTDRAYLGILGVQSDHDPPSHVEWDTSSIVGNLITLSAGAAQLAGIITLVGGHTYRIGLGMDVNFDIAAGTVKIQIFNRTLAALLMRAELTLLIEVVRRHVLPSRRPKASPEPG